MPKLPDFTSLGERQAQPARGVAQYRGTTGFEDVPGRVTEEAGAIVRQAGNELGRDASIVRVEQERLDTVKAEDAFNKLRQAQLALTVDPNGGFANLKGGDAIKPDVIPTYTQKFKDAATKINEGLDNDNQKRLFTRRKDVADFQYQGELLKHVAQQSEAYENNVTNATVATEIQRAALDPMNNVVVEGALARANAAIDSHGAHRGYAQDNPVLVEARAKVLDSVNSARVKTLINTSPLAAEALYDTLKPTLNAQTAFVLGHELKTAVTPIKAKMIADLAMTPADDQQLATALEVKGTPAVESVAGAVPASAVIGSSDPQKLHQDNIASINSELKIQQANLKGAKSEKQATQYGNAIQTLQNELASEQTLLQKAAAGGTPTAPPNAIPVTLNSSGTPTKTRDTRAMLGDWISRGEQMAQAERPNDPAFRDMVLQNIKGRVANVVAIQDGKQKQAQGALIQASMGANNTSPPTTTAELFSIPGARDAFIMMDDQAQRGILALLDHNARSLSGENVKSNPAVVQGLFNLIHVDESDPNKLRSPAQLARFFGPDPTGRTQLNRTDYDWLKRELEASRTPEGNSFLRDVNNTRNAAARIMKAGIMGRMLADTQPEKIEEAAYAFNLSLDAQIEAYRKAGKDPRQLLTPGSPDYALAPGRVQSFLQTPQAALGDAAGKVRAGALDVADLTAPAASYDAATFGNRTDGTAKGTGFLGVLKGKNGVMTEYTVGVNINGKEMDVPTLVPTLTRKEVESVLAEKITPEIEKKAADFARNRIATGKPVFATAAESPPVKIAGDADYNKLPKGARYVGPDGVPRVK